MDFSCSIVEEKFSGFVFLIEAKLDDDVGNVHMDLFMRSRKQVKAIVTHCGQVHLDSEQVFRLMPSYCSPVCSGCIVYDAMVHLLFNRLEKQNVSRSSFLTEYLGNYSPEPRLLEN